MKNRIEFPLLFGNELHHERPTYNNICFGICIDTQDLPSKGLFYDRKTIKLRKHVGCLISCDIAFRELLCVDRDAIIFLCNNCRDKDGLGNVNHV
jgi:hypothetical protein